MFRKFFTLFQREEGFFLRGSDLWADGVIVRGTIGAPDLYNILIMESTSKTLLPPHQQISNFQWGYSDAGPKPCAYFWSQLARSRQSPRLLVPDTLVVNLKEQPLLWLFSGPEGRLCHSSNVSLKDFVGKVTSYCSPNELVGVLKRAVGKPQPNGQGNDARVVNSRYLHNLSMQQLGDQVVVIQKYVKAHGKQAFVCRTVLREGLSSHCFLITNRSSFYDDSVPEAHRFLVTNGQNSRNHSKFTIARSATGKHLAQTLPMLREIVDNMRFQRGIYLTELVGDFIRDEEGNWWLTDVKAFKVDPRPRATLSSPSQQLRLGDKEKYQRTRECRYCQISYLQSQLAHKLTKQMLVEMDRYLLHLGRSYEWLSRCDLPTDTHFLYQEQIVCHRCYRLYTEMQALLAFQAKFLAKLGLNSQGNPKELLMRLTSKEELQMQAKDKEILNLKDSIPREISLGPNSSIITHEGRPLRNDQTIHQMARYRFMLYLHELDELVGVLPNTSYHLEFSLFNTKFRTKLDLRPDTSSVLIKKLRVCYFFFPTDTELTNLQEYIQKQEVLSINLIAQNRAQGERKQVGCLTLGLKEFLVPGRKNFYKFFDTEYGFGWGLEGSIGIVRTQKEVNTSRLILTTEDRLVYLPSKNYFICESLPEDWVAELETKAGKSNNKAFENTLKASDCHMKTPLQTGDRFIPDHTFMKETKKTEIDWKAELSKQLRTYERKAFKDLKQLKRA